MRCGQHAVQLSAESGRLADLDWRARVKGAGQGTTAQHKEVRCAVVVDFPHHHLATRVIPRECCKASSELNAAPLPTGDALRLRQLLSWWRLEHTRGPPYVRKPADSVKKCTNIHFDVNNAECVHVSTQHVPVRVHTLSVISGRATDGGVGIIIRLEAARGSRSLGVVFDHRAVAYCLQDSWWAFSLPRAKANPK